MSLLGNMPDFYISALYGSMLDIFEGVSGYKYIFIIMILHALGAVVCAVILQGILKKEAKAGKA